MKSMTGFGRAEGIVESHLFTVELKSVNHRYLDARFRLPPGLSLYESAFLEKLRGQVERGAFDVAIKQKLAPTATTASMGTRFVVDEVALKTLVESWNKAKKKVKITGSPTPDGLIFTNRIFVPVEDTQDVEGILAGVLTIFTEALKALLAMRAQEGDKLQSTLQESLSELVNRVKQMQPIADQQPKKVAEKLKARLSTWQLTSAPDSQRLETELALYAERSDVAEELARLETHCEAFRKLLAEKKGVGRRLDFLTQEMQREINTLGAKAAVLELTQLSLEAKSLVERLREQVQNVE